MCIRDRSCRRYCDTSFRNDVTWFTHGATAITFPYSDAMARRDTVRRVRLVAQGQISHTKRAYSPGISAHVFRHIYIKKKDEVQ